jgi:8-oxo-dGTP pyrophosphatase MutT (NUDIX family)
LASGPPAGYLPDMFEAIHTHLSARDPVRADPEGRMPAAVAVTLFDGPAGTELLLIKRVEHSGDPWSGQMALPGGRMEQEDADLLETAVRETREETGVDLAEVRLLGSLDDLSPTTPHLPPIYVRPFVFGLDERPHAEALEEVDLTLWVGLEELAGSRVRERIQVSGFDIEVDGYRLGPHLVWGMTERILTPLVELYRELS